MRVAVVGHIEYATFARVEHLPAPGEIVHAVDFWEEAGGGGAVAAVQLVKLAGAALFLTALGDDHLARRAREELEAKGVELHGCVRRRPQRRAFTHTDAGGERTITVIGDRLVPHGDDDLPWDALRDTDAVYLTGGDVVAIRAARKARVLVATPRARPALTEAAVALDALVHSGKDPSEVYTPGELDPPPRYVVTTRGSAGGVYTAEGVEHAFRAAPLPGPVVDAYGAGDSFAAGLTFGLGRGDDIVAALELAARCGAACMTGRGPYEGQLRLVG
jgi:ribokinase